MLDLNASMNSESDPHNNTLFFKDDSETSNIASSSNSSSLQCRHHSLSTLNFSILKSDHASEIEDESSMLTRHLFPLKDEQGTMKIQGKSQCWLKLSVPESGGAEMGIYKPPAKKS